MPRKYQIDWPEEFDELNIELACFRHGHSPEKGGLGKAEHFKRAALLLWGPHNERKQFRWHPFAETMLEAACKYEYLSVSGPGNIGKSEFFAIWSIINWLCDPMNTMVAVTSTSLKSSRKRIWGSITEYYQAVPQMPGKLVDSLGMIRTQDPEHGVRGSDKSGISLVAGEPAKEKESMDKLMGCHNRRVLLIGDELPALSHNLVKFALSNLATNPYFQFVGIGNPRSRFDPHGLFSTPKAGWNSISDKDYEWETEMGYAIRFDAEQSPNVLENQIIFEFLPTREDIINSRNRNGEDSLEYWSQTRGFWPPEGSDPECIYSESDIADGDGMSDNVRWIGTPIPVAGCDPAWTHGGDAVRVVFGLLGMEESGQQTLLVTDDVRINDQKSNPSPRIFQVAHEFVTQCRRRGIGPRNVAFDSTGGGALFGDILAELWGDAGALAVNFSAAPSGMFVGVSQTPANEVFADKVSEMWMCGKDFLRCGQIKGLTADIINDMIARKEVARKHGSQSGIKRAVEGKRIMRKRIRRSPDAGDAFFILLELCRARFKFRPNVSKVANKQFQKKWSDVRERFEAPERETMQNVDDMIGTVAKRGKWRPELDEEADWAQAFYR